MRINVSVVVVVVVLALVLPAARAGADDLAASADNAVLLIERISKDKIEAVYQEPMHESGQDTEGALSWVWSDAKTLWVLRQEGEAKLSVAKIVDLHAEPARPITLADFKLKREPVAIPSPPDVLPPSDGKIQPGLFVTTSGQVWLSRCIAYRKFEDCKSAYLRIDQPAPFTTKLPANLDDPEASIPVISAPDGYSATFKVVKARGLTFRGAECKGPHGESVSGVLYEVWPPGNARFVDPKVLVELAQVRITKIEWVRAAPPVVRYVNHKRDMTWTTYIEDCEEVHPAPILLEDGRWIDRSEVRRADGSELGSMRGGDRVVVAPRPMPIP